ncbi:MAG: neutral zinc metallopeptidase, partial [Candidatus Limnocylindrales bacterium]
MRWRRSGSTQVEDRRGAGGGGGLGGMRMGGLGGGGIPIPMGGGIGGIVLVVIIIVVLNLVGGTGGATGGLTGGQGGAISSLSPDDDLGQFVNAVTVDVQAYWNAKLAESGTDYPETVTVLFTDSTQSGCGVASSQTGPFYCPADQKVYLDTAFFDDLSSRFGAPGDFAQAYVIAHEYGHHVQDVLGSMAQAQSGGNDASIRLELQADCYAGMWANSVWKSPDQSDVESITEADVREAINAAQAVGDDRIQKQSTGTINQDTWTHGSADQRAKWFNTGF